MNWVRLHGVQYIRLAPGAAERVAPYLRTSPEEIRELVLDLAVWPVGIRPAPLKGRDGRLIAGDPVLLDANEAGLLLAGGPDGHGEPVLVRWEEIRSLQILGRMEQEAGV